MKMDVQALILASKLGQLDNVKYLCSIEGVDVNAKNNYGITALMMAARNDNIEIVKYLCSKEGVDINATDSNGNTALIMAVYHGHIETVQHLCSIEVVDINITNNAGWTALMMAAHTGYIENVKFLCSIENLDINLKANHGITNFTKAVRMGSTQLNTNVDPIKHVDANMKLNCGMTALMMAVSNRRSEVVKHLCSTKGIDANAKNDNGMTALIIAAHDGDIEIVECLCSIDGIHVNARANSDIITQCRRKTNRGRYFEVNDLLLTEHTDFDIDGDFGVTALMIASCNGHLEVVKHLCSREDVDVNVKDKNGTTAVMMAASNSHIEIVKYLCSISDVDINAKDLLGETALMHVIDSGQTDVIQILCSCEDIDLNASDKNGKTALMIAAYHGDLDTINSMIDVDVNLRDKYGRTGVFYAAINGHTECVQYLFAKHGFNVSDSIEKLIVCTLEGNVTVLHETLLTDTIISEYNILEALLVIASATGQTGCVDYLLSTSAYVNGFEMVPRTPLMLAAMNGHNDCVRSLLKTRAIDTNKCDKNGRTALMLAAMNGRTECVKSLIITPIIDVWKMDENNQTAFELAIRNGHASCLSLFVDIKEQEVETDDTSAIESNETAKTSLFNAFRARTNGTSNGYKPGIPWKCLSLKDRKCLSLKDTDCKEKTVLDLEIRNGLHLCPFCFILGQCDSDESPCSHKGLRSKFSHEEHMSPEKIMQEKEPLKLAVESGNYQCLEYVVRYFSLLFHMKVDLLNNHSNLQYLYPKYALTRRRRYCNCGTCESSEGSDGVRRNCVDYLLSEHIVTDSLGDVHDSPLALAVLKGYYKFTKFLLQNIHEHHKISESTKRIFLHAASNLEELKYVSTFLKRGVFDWSWYPEFPTEKISYLARELVIHGYSPWFFAWKIRWLTPLKHAFAIGNIGLVKYLIANLYLTEIDFRVLQKIACEYLQQDNMSEGIIQLHQELTNTPWSLQALSFLRLSFSKNRIRREPNMMKDELPTYLQKRLTFTNSIRMLCVRQWDYILSDSVKCEAVHEWLNDKFLILGETFVTQEPIGALRNGMCCNGKCRVIKPQFVRDISA